MLVLNRDVRESMVPSFSYEAIAKVELNDGSPSPHPLAISDLTRFANTFDPHFFESETGKKLGDEIDFRSYVDRIGSNGETDIDFSNLRWALWMQLQEPPYPSDDVDKSKLVDRLLDAIHWEVSGKKRRTTGCGPYEPWIGTRGSLIGSGQLRFEITTGVEFDRDRIFDLAAGLMLRTYGEGLIPRSLGLYPPSYRIDGSGLVDHCFMVLIQRPGSSHSLESPNGDQGAQDEFAKAVQRRSLSDGLSIEDS